MPQCFCVDEKTAIQALDRLDPVLPLSPGRAERHGFEYFRHGTLSLYGRPQREIGQGDRQDSEAAHQRRLHRIYDHGGGADQVGAGNPFDNLSAHKTKAVEQFLQENPKVRFHFTPTYSSWLNQVELWFAKIQRDIIDRGVFTSVADLARKLRRYICAYEKQARPFRWTYTHPQRRIHTNAITGTAH
jgi:hypothetical protein